MSIKIEIQSRNRQRKEYILSKQIQEIFVEYGDLVFIYESKNNTNFCIQNYDLKLDFLNGCSVVLRNFVKLIEENPTQNIAPQFSDLSLLSQLTTKLEFVKSSLFDEEFCIKDIKTLHDIVARKEQREQKIESILHKSVKFQAQKQKNIQIQNEEFEYFLKENLKIFIHN